jgi:hypothetical protein
MACPTGSTQIFSDQVHSILNMTMDKKTDNRRRGLGSRGPYQKGDSGPPLPLPEYIRLPDGRTFLLSELMKFRPDRKHYNLLSKSRQTRPPSVGRPTKYTMEDREWQAQASTEEIMAKYNMNRGVARTVKSYARRLVEIMNQHGEDIVINDYTKKAQPGTDPG